MINVPAELEADSEDLTAEEIEAGVPVTSIDAMLRQLHEIRCPECGGGVEASDHALRRRAPYFYARMGLRCAKGHSGKVVFRADWLSTS